MSAEVLLCLLLSSHQREIRREWLDNRCTAKFLQSHCHKAIHRSTNIFRTTSCRFDRVNYVRTNERHRSIPLKAHPRLICQNIIPQAEHFDRVLQLIRSFSRLETSNYASNNKLLLRCWLICQNILT